MTNPNDFKGYNGNPNLKRSNQQIEWTPELLQEWTRCAQDPIYFAETYMKIISVDDGLMNLNLYPYQADMIKSMHGYRKQHIRHSASGW
jgi:hypothetical protein